VPAPVSRGCLAIIRLRARCRVRGEALLRPVTGMAWVKHLRPNVWRPCAQLLAYSPTVVNHLMCDRAVIRGDGRKSPGVLPVALPNEQARILLFARAREHGHAAEA
jgi:hypothetical protein